MKGYEVDFVGVVDSSQDADAIAMRLFDEKGNERVVVYDGGFQAHADAMIVLLKKYYFSNMRSKVIDSVICSHPDQDHVAGLIDILKTFEVKKLYVNRPWMFARELLACCPKLNMTVDSLVRKLKDEYKYIARLEEIAFERNIEICEAFQGCDIADDLIVMSPTRELYVRLLLESDKTPVQTATASDFYAGSVSVSLKKCMDKIKETWMTEYLREDVSTSAENEMSVVIFGKIVDRPFLLTGDAGVEALKTAMNYFFLCQRCEMRNYVQLYQIPHHGGRHNVTPSILNRLVGQIGSEGFRQNKTAVASVAKDSDHPLKMVVNAFIRRGCEVLQTNGQTICCSCHGTARNGWGKVEELEFNEMVEAWTED